MNVNVGSLIRRERQRQGLSLRELARRVGVSASMLSQVETDRTRPSVRHSGRFAKAVTRPLLARCARG